jgi:hypothetical protein
VEEGDPVSIDELPDILEREAQKHSTHVANGTSLGGESPAWNEGAAAGLRAAASLVRGVIAERDKSQTPAEHAAEAFLTGRVPSTHPDPGYTHADLALDEWEEKS